MIFMKKIRYMFTLIEMIVVLVIIAVMTAIAAPKLANFYQNVELDSSVQRFRTFLDTARMKAALENSECRVIIRRGWRKIDMETRRTQPIKTPDDAVEYIKNGTRTAAGAFKPAEGSFSTMELPDGVSINYISLGGAQKAPVQEISITFTGFSEPDAVRFVFQNAKNEYMGLQIEEKSGIVSDLQVIQRD